MKKRLKKMNQTTRVVVLSFIALFVVFVFFVRLVYLQVFDGENFQSEALAQRRRSVELRPERGAIYDRNRNALAISVTVNNAYLDPHAVDDSKDVKERLMHILGLEEKAVESALQSKRYSVLLKTRLSQQEVDAIADSNLSRCVMVLKEPYRYYPNGSLLAQTLGYVDGEENGTYGVEQYYDRFLRGISGERVYSNDLARGKSGVIPVENTESHAPIPGSNVYLTIDVELQRILSQALQEGWAQHQPKRLWGIIMDPNSGEILAMDALPTFDPNQPRLPLSIDLQTQWDGLNEEEQLNYLYEMWANPLVTSLYEPGSVFKTLTTAIALETHSSKEGQTYFCKGYEDIMEDVRINCIRWYDPHGEQTLAQALANSCNPAFVQVVKEIGAKPYMSYLHSLHMGSATGVDLFGEPDSLFPARVEDLSLVQMCTSAYGHGISVTPLQMISACNATINGGYYHTPHLMKQITDTEGKNIQVAPRLQGTQVFSTDTSNTMREYLVQAVKDSGSPLGGVQSVRVGGKSGTSEKLQDGRYVENKTFASYWSFFPADAPKYSVLIVADEPKSSVFGSVVAGSINKSVVERVLDYEKRGSVSNEEGLQTVPNLTGLTVEKAREKLQTLGLHLSTFGDMHDLSLIRTQHPDAGVLLQPKEIVQVQGYEDQAIEMPDLTGMDPAAIEQRFQGLSITVETKGQGKVISQQPQAGERLLPNTKIQVILTK